MKKMLFFVGMFTLVFGLSSYLSAGSDCNHFYDSESTDGQELECPPGLEFNEILQVCNFPEAAGCEAAADTVQKDMLGHDRTCVDGKLSVAVKVGSGVSGTVSGQGKVTYAFLCDEYKPNASCIQIKC